MHLPSTLATLVFRTQERVITYAQMVAQLTDSDRVRQQNQNKLSYCEGQIAALTAVIEDILNAYQCNAGYVQRIATSGIVGKASYRHYDLSEAIPESQLVFLRQKSVRRVA